MIKGLGASVALDLATHSMCRPDLAALTVGRSHSKCEGGILWNI